jgi:hypothetical protein
MTEHLSAFDDYIDNCKYILQQKGIAWRDDMREQFVALSRYRVDIGKEKITMQRDAEQAVAEWSKDNG